MPRVMFLCACLLALAACSTSPDRDPVIGEAYAGPATMPLRDDLSLRARTLATVRHGERLDIIGRRRRFYKVRTEQGVEGWVDGHQLLGEAEIKALRNFVAGSSRMPSMGAATVFEPLNVHTVPNRFSPSFAQIPADGSVDVLGTVMLDRAPYDPPELVVRAAPPAPRKKKPPKEKTVPPPPRGKPPEVPANWLELSGNPKILSPPEPDEVAEVPPARESWALIRLKDGTAGWTLTRLLVMSIPDEVAQYAERARIVAYFALDSVADEGQIKNTWLWATRVSATQGCDFDSFRVFVWSLKRHRYETAYIERRVHGLLPIDARPAVGAAPPQFAILAEEPEGTLARREFVFAAGRVRQTKKAAAERPAPLWQPPPGGDALKAAPTPAPESTFREQAVGILKAIRNRLKR